MNYALGLIETRGLVSAIEAADAMVKAADVRIIGKEKVTGGLILIKVFGETAAVKASVDAGSVAAQRVGELVSAHVIPRPDDQIDLIIFDKKTEKTAKADDKIITPKIKSETAKANTVTKPVVREKNSQIKAEKKVVQNEKIESSVKKDIKPESFEGSINTISKKLPSMDQLVVLNVHALRRIARGFENFPIKGREISKANRTKLLDYFKSLQ